MIQHKVRIFADRRTGASGYFGNTFSNLTQNTSDCLSNMYLGHFGVLSGVQR